MKRPDLEAEKLPDEPSKAEEISDDEHARSWAEEAARRDDELERDPSLARAAEDVFHDARARLEKPSLSVTFDEPDAGWIGLEVRAGEQRFAETFSRIYPSLQDLCSALCDVINGAPSRPVVFLLEAPELELRITPEPNDGAHVVLRVFRDRRRDRAGETVLEAHASARTIVMTFWRALRRLETQLSPSEFEARFGESFPALEMASLTRLIEKRWRAADRS